MIVIWWYDIHYTTSGWWAHVAQMTCFQKIFGRHGLTGLKLEIWPIWCYADHLIMADLGDTPLPPFSDNIFGIKLLTEWATPGGWAHHLLTKSAKQYLKAIEKTIDLMTMRSSKLTWKHSDKEDYYSWTTLPKRHPKVNDSMWKSTRMKKPTRLLKQIPCRTQRYERSSLLYMTKLFSCHPPLPASDLSMKWFWWSCF